MSCPVHCHCPDRPRGGGRPPMAMAPDLLLLRPVLGDTRFRMHWQILPVTRHSPYLADMTKLRRSSGSLRREKRKEIIRRGPSFHIYNRKSDYSRICANKIKVRSSLLRGSTVNDRHSWHCNFIARSFTIIRDNYSAGQSSVRLSV